MTFLKVSQNGQHHHHSDDIQDIITAQPAWILRWGLTLFFAILIMILCLSALIRYPDIIRTSLKVDSPNSPEPVVSKVSGKLVKLLVKDNEMVSVGQPLAYMESTADHKEVMTLLQNLKDIQKKLQLGLLLGNSFFFDADRAHFGELQQSYQVFFRDYLSYKSSIEEGFYVKKKMYLGKDLLDIEKQQKQLNSEKVIRQRDFKLAEDEYSIHQKLASEKVETSAELRQQESKYLAKKSPLVQMESALVAANTDYLAKQKEILELENQIAEEKAKFFQSLNSLISQTEDWKSKYVLMALQKGKLTYAGIIQENQVLTPGQEVFYINPGNENFFGVMPIPQYNLGKVKVGQQVLIKLKSYPFEEYGVVKGKIEYIADVPFKDSIFISKVDFNIRMSSVKRPVHLKQGMKADAEIITQDATILQRLVRNISKIINGN
ncbi:HlyD family secretion protein [Mucilaginibacter rubeus]|uniref:HlyD family efflux transporter periplasmic adaptor subunit n=1 Tax=Mucilaginibacter rubeus TaxID=2027860 RepID=A0A5C1I233_9SPHI|nr:HlyD family efflux transporter periplasmic adaptor subunit [Mucilaginibacter rubeus]QEM11388.1 HlyD family efflux transporter periplasmic adaptor subunit [Mucilaginibacter rubeus]